MLSELLSTIFERRHRSRGLDRADDRPLPELTADLVGAQGEASGIAVARSILDRFGTLDDAGKLEFFMHLARDMRIDVTRVRETLDRYDAQESRVSYRARGSHRSACRARGA